MQKPFPALTSLAIGGSKNMPMTVFPQGFLGGSAQHLQSCNLSDVEFPGIWKLLLTTNHLVALHLWHIPHSMYTSPEGMATCLSTMPHLKSLSVGFRPPESLHDFPGHPNRLLSPLTRGVLPSLTEFRFQVMSGYIEDFVSRIDVPPNREFFRGRLPRQSYARCHLRVIAGKLRSGGNSPVSGD